MSSTPGFKWTPGALRIALVGKTGCGKSSTGNTILGREDFIAKPCGISVTHNCSKVESVVDGRRVAVVDTPGLFDTSLSNKEIIRETYKSVSLLAPGPHAFLLLIQIGRFTEEEKNAVEYIKEAFGKEADKYIMILFTRGDDLENGKMSIEDYIHGSSRRLQELVADCGNRFHVFNNRKKDRAQVKELLQKIDHMVKENGGSCYTNDMLREAEEAIQKEKERILKEKDEEMRREMEKIERKYQLEMERFLQLEKRRQAEMEKMMKMRQEHELRTGEPREPREREQRQGETERESGRAPLVRRLTEKYEKITNEQELQQREQQERDRERGQRKMEREQMERCRQEEEKKINVSKLKEQFETGQKQEQLPERAGREWESRGGVRASLVGEEKEEIRRNLERLLQKQKQKQREEKQPVEDPERIYEEIKVEAERESEQRKEEQRQENARRCAEEVELLKQQFEEEARAKAEIKNSFLDKVVDFVVAGMTSIIKWFRRK